MFPFYNYKKTAETSGEYQRYFTLACHLVKHHLADTNVSREKGLLLSFVYKFGQVACRCC
jgi:hypothetical protein